MSPKPKGAKRERRKRNSVRLEGVGTSLTAETGENCFGLEISQVLFKLMIN